MEPRTPPKFVPTLTEVAVQDAGPISEENTPLAPDQSALAAPEHIANDNSVSPSRDMLRRRREADAPELAEAPSDLDIANLPTQSGWAQMTNASALSATNNAQALPSATDYAVDTKAMPPATQIDAAAMQTADNTAATHVEGLVDGQGDTPLEVAPIATTQTLAASEAATASLVASAAQAAQELEDAITRRVLKRVQETLDARLASAVLQVVERQTALLQSSLQLEVDATIREAVADAVAQVLHPDDQVPEQGGE